MSSSNDRQSGVPTRVIHESYVEMLQAIKHYYRADQQGTDAQREQAHANLQQAVLSFFEVLRPYLKSKKAVQEYWHGEIPNYNGSEGTAILAEQSQRIPVDTDYLEKQSTNGSWKEQSMEWLEGELREAYPKLNGNSKIADLHYEDDVLLLKVNQYQAGLKHLDGKYEMSETRVDRGSDYMRHESTETTQKRKMPIQKLFRAAHALEEAADRMNKMADIKEERSKYLAGGDANEYPEPFGEAEKPID